MIYLQLSRKSIRPSDKDVAFKKIIIINKKNNPSLRRLGLNHGAIPSSGQSRSRPLALIMRLVFYCVSTNRKTYGVNLDAPRHIHPGVISTKATEAASTFRQPKGPAPIISPRQFAPHITRQSQESIAPSLPPPPPNQGACSFGRGPFCCTTRSATEG